jgi:hypothetical protein
MRLEHTGFSRASRFACAALVVASTAIGCSTGTADAGQGECTTMAECGDVDEVCDRCAPLASALCDDGACVERAADAVDVSATVSIEPRQLVVTSLVYAVVSKTTGLGELACADAVSASGFADELNVFATGYKALSGGSFHPDVSFGRSPEGDIAVVLLGTDGSGGGGDIIATGCMSGLTAEGSALSIELITLDGL